MDERVCVSPFGSKHLTAEEKVGMSEIASLSAATYSIHMLILNFGVYHAASMLSVVRFWNIAPAFMLTELNV